MFGKRRFPYQYECDGCGATETVEHEDVQDVPSYVTLFDVAEAVEYEITNRRGWSVESPHGPLCPDCIDGMY